MWIGSICEVIHSHFCSVYSFFFCKSILCLTNTTVQIKEKHTSVFFFCSIFLLCLFSFVRSVSVDDDDTILVCLYFVLIDGMKK